MSVAAPDNGGPYRTSTPDGRPMVRVTLRLDGRNRTLWAAKTVRGERIIYQAMTDEGDLWRETKKVDVLKELIVVSPSDVVSEKPARLNLKYAEMELVEET